MKLQASHRILQGKLMLELVFTNRGAYGFIKFGYL